MSEAKGGTRVQRLVRVLTEGTTADVKREAGRQLAELCRSSPDHLMSFQWRIAPLLCHRDWDTRMAAADALGLMARFFPHPPTVDLWPSVGGAGGPDAESNGPSPSDPANDGELLTLSGFDVDAVVGSGIELVKGPMKQQSDWERSLRSLPPAERKRQLRRRLLRELDLEDLDSTLGIQDIVGVGEEDVMREDEAADTGGEEEKGGAADALQSALQMSTRERARLKRRAATSTMVATAGKWKKGADGGKDVPGDDGFIWGNIGAEVDSAKEHQAILAGRWPFQTLCNELHHALLDPCWEVRHGAAAALRDILTWHAKGCGASRHAWDAQPAGAEAGKRAARAVKKEDGPGLMFAHGSDAPMAAEEARRHRVWMENCVVRLCVVLAIDRLTDIQDSQVTAPVSETAAQALGVVARALERDQLEQLLLKLGQMAARVSEGWETQHGGLLGIKYVGAAVQAALLSADTGASGPVGDGQGAVKAEEGFAGQGGGGPPADGMASAVDAVLGAVAAGLERDPDMCQAVAAQCLKPVLPALFRPRAAGYLKRVVAALERALAIEDELNSFPASAMMALGDMHAFGHVPELDRASLLPRTLPFCFHHIVSVRLAALSCLRGLLERPVAPGSAVTKRWLPGVLGTIGQALVQVLTTEQEAEVVRAAAGTVPALAGAVSITAGAPADVAKRLPRWLGLMSLPRGSVVGQDLAESFLACSGSMGRCGRGFEVGSGARAPMEAAVAVAEAIVAMADAGGCPGEERVLREAVASTVGGALRGAAWSPKIAASLLLTIWARSRPSGTLADVPEVGAMHSAVLAAVSGPWGLCPELQGHTRVLSMEMQALSGLCQSLGCPMALVEGLDLAAPDPRLALRVLEPGPPASLASLASSGGDRAASAAQAVRVWDRVLGTARTAAAALESQAVSAAGMLAAAAVVAGELPVKLNALIQPLMASVRREPDPTLALHVAFALAVLVSQCSTRPKSPNAKIIANVCELACTATQAPRAGAPAGTQEGDAVEGSDANGEASAGTGGQWRSKSGDQEALRALCTRFGAELPIHASPLWERLTGPLAPGRSPEDLLAGPVQPLLDALHLLRVVAAALSAALVQGSLPTLGQALRCLKHEMQVVRDTAASALAALTDSHPRLVLPYLLAAIPAVMSDMTSAAARRGGVGLTALLAASSQHLVPYSPLLLTPLLARMSDPEPDMRAYASATFGRLMPMLALAQGATPPEGLDAALAQRLAQESRLVEQVLDNSKAQDNRLPVAIAGDLRPYQQDGINWLAFLRHFHLHGVLADDMGLGKTLQSAAIMASSAAESAQAWRDNPGTSPPPLPSLVVCPATLVGHWAHEVSRWIPGGVLRPIAIQGSGVERQRLWAQVFSANPNAPNLAVTSYESLRADVAVATSRSWDYAVLDEGHAIRNPKSAVTAACKRLVAAHRLVLSGTPIQNDVLELWSIFDFLMPGFLGSQRAFNAKFGRALKETRRQGKGVKDAQEGLLALDKLHKQVMPFILRRTKDQVLKDLPPKIIQDVLVDPTPLQLALLDMARGLGGAHEGDRGAGGEPGPSSSAASGKETTHVFQALQVMRKVCSHPGLALNLSDPGHAKAAREALGTCDPTAVAAALRDVAQSPKLMALKELLVDCGIGVASEEQGQEAVAGSEAGGHRALVFAQSRALLDLVEADVLRPLGVPSVRLDGSVDAAQRFRVVKEFNEDPSVPVMLLTTHVGGLGLNLTSADTVVFLEHDWNPMKDLQAMDRAHRLGQRRTVNVYRILVQGTLEEQIMSLQRFKVDVANAVVNADNMALSSMDTSQLLNLFEGDGKRDAPSGAQEPDALLGLSDPESVGRRKAKQSALAEALAELERAGADADKYKDEFSLDNFAKRLAGN